MLFKIARDLGKTVGELKHGSFPLQAYEFAEWLAFYQIEADEQKKAAKPKPMSGPRKLPMGVEE